MVATDKKLILERNPFNVWEAEQEREDLKDRLFVLPENFDQIRSARTLIVYAPRGCGKTAFRVFLANEAAPLKTTGIVDTFALEFTSFDGLIKKLAAKQDILIEDYVDEILRLGAKALFSYLFEKRKTQRFHLGLVDQIRLGKLIRLYAPELLALESVLNILSQDFPGISSKYDEFLLAFREKKVTALLDRETLGRDYAYAYSLAGILEMDADDQKVRPNSVLEQIQLLVTLIQSLGFNQLLVLVDRVDETQQTANNPRLQAQLLAPLLSHLQLLEAPGLAFKFFIPENTRQTLIEERLIREDRVNILELTLHWEETRLKKLLEKRLDYYGAKDFWLLFSRRPQDHPQNGTDLDIFIEEAMLRFAKGSPRWLILAGRSLLNAYSRRKNADLITWNDWLEAEKELEAMRSRVGQNDAAVSVEQKQVDEPPPIPQKPESASPENAFDLLHISEKPPLLVLKEIEIPLTNKEFAIIGFLIKHRGYAESRHIENAVWGGTPPEGGLDQNLARIRLKIDQVLGESSPISAKESYIMKKGGWVRLAHYTIDD